VFRDRPYAHCEAFSAFTLRRARSQRVRFELRPHDLSMVTEAGDMIVAEGKYNVSVGGGQPYSDASVLTKTFTVKGEMNLPE
jgi:beta-glucosidase